MDKKISVIIPVYKVEQYLNRCVESVMSQTYLNLEIILVDDGSPDRCPQLCDSLAAKDNRVRVVHKKNGGLSSARNAGLDVATGDYVAFVDSDDYIDENMIETMLSAAIRNGVSVACCGRIRVSNSTQIKMFDLPEEKVLSGKQAIKELMLGGCVEEASWDKLYKAEVFKSRRFPIGEINEDIVQTIEILGDCKNIVHVGKALYYYCENVGSITKNGYDSSKYIIIKHLDQVGKYIENNYPELSDCFAVLVTRYCQSMLYLLLDNGAIYKKHYSEYRMFYNKFKHNFAKTYVRKFESRSELFKGWLIFLKLYYPLHRIKKSSTLLSRKK